MCRHLTNSSQQHKKPNLHSRHQLLKDEIGTLLVDITCTFCFHNKSFSPLLSQSLSLAAGVSLCGGQGWGGTATAWLITTSFILQLTQCPQPLQVLRQRQLSAPGPAAGLYGGGGSGSGTPTPSSGSWPTNPIHIKQEIQIPQVTSSTRESPVQQIEILFNCDHLKCKPNHLFRNNHPHLLCLKWT